MFLHAARLQAHSPHQWLARAARATIPRAAGRASHQPGLGRLVRRARLRTRCRTARGFGFRVADLTLAFLDVHPHQLALDGRTDTEVRTWLGGHVAARNLSAGKLDDPLPYALPDHVLALGARYSLEELGEALEVLAPWYANADKALAGVQAAPASKKWTPPVRCWPHHFDLDCLVELPRGHSMGVGHRPGDEFCDEPYFYTSMWPEPSIPGLPLLPAMAHWHTFKFLAAMAPAHKLVAAHDQGGYVRQFLDVSVAAALNALR